MANTFKVLFRGSASVGSTTLYTTPSATTTLVTNVAVANSASANATFSMELGNTAIATDVTVPANDSLILEYKQVLEANDTIDALASASTVAFHVSGLEIT